MPKWSQEHNLFLLRFHYPLKSFFLLQNSLTFSMWIISEYFGTQERKAAKWESFRLGMSVGPRLMLVVAGTLVVVLYSNWVVLVVGGAVEVICLKFVA